MVCGDNNKNEQSIHTNDISLSTHDNLIIEKVSELGVASDSYAPSVKEKISNKSEFEQPNFVQDDITSTRQTTCAGNEPYYRKIIYDKSDGRKCFVGLTDSNIVHWDREEDFASVYYPGDKNFKQFKDRIVNGEDFRTLLNDTAVFKLTKIIQTLSMGK